MLIQDDQEQLDRTLSIAMGILGEEMVGAYLFGSAVQGGLRPDSDLDIFVVTRRATTLSEKTRLASEIMRISGRSAPEGMWRRVDLTVTVQSDIKPWRFPPKLDFQYGDWLRVEFEKGKYEPLPPRRRPDLALLITMVLAADASLVGPPPAFIFDPVPHDDLLMAMVSDLERLRDEIDRDTRNVILTLARMWSTFATGEIRTKDAAADWVVNQLPDPYKPIVTHARKAYLGDEADQWDRFGAAIPPCVDYMIAEIARQSSGR